MRYEWLVDALFEDIRNKVEILGSDDPTVVMQKVIKPLQDEQIFSEDLLYGLFQEAMEYIKVYLAIEVTITQGDLL